MPDASLKKRRPLWFNLSLLNLPLPGIVSILHRISGALLFLLLPWLLYLLDSSLASAERYAAFKQAIAIKRGYAPAYRGLGFVYQRLGQKAKAIANLQKYLELSPGAKDARSVRDRITAMGGSP